MTDLKDYWRRATLGNITDVEMTPWAIVDQDWSTFKDATDNQDFVHRHAWWQLCRDQADSNGWIKPGYVTVVMLPRPIPTIPFGGGPGWALVATGLDASDIAHETGHAIGLGHSWGDAPDFGPLAVYNDPFDVMGNLGMPYSYSDASGSHWGPGLAAQQLINLGYLPPSRVTSFAATAGSSLRLRALSHYEQSGFLIAQGVGITLEFRTNDGPDAGLRGPRLVIHRDNGGSPVTVIAALVQGESRQFISSAGGDPGYVSWQANPIDASEAIVTIGYGLASGPAQPLGSSTDTSGSMGGQPPGACQPGDTSFRCVRLRDGLPELSAP